MTPRSGAPILPPMRVDTVVIGGGLMGCGVGLRLAQAGQKVHVIEKAVPGAEASSAAAGILGPQSENDVPGPLLDLGLRSLASYPEFAAELRDATGIDVLFHRSGVLKVAFTGEGAEKLRQRAAWQSKAGLRAELLGDADARKLEPGLAENVLAALHLPNEAQVDPRLLSKAVSGAAARAGATLQPATVASVLLEGGRARGVELAGGEKIEADAVVVAAGAWSGLIPNAGRWAREVQPARGQLVQLEVRPGTVRHVVFTERGYLVPRQDGRLLAGSTLEFVGFDKQVTAGGLHRVLDLALSAVPSLAGAPIRDHWAGFRPYTQDGVPLIGPSALGGLFFATGHHRNGILLAPITSRLVADAVLQKRLDVDLTPFAPERARA